jgi:hypothetical protein
MIAIFIDILVFFALLFTIATIWILPKATQPQPAPTEMTYQSEFTKFSGKGLPPYTINEIHAREMTYRSSVLVYDKEIFALRQAQNLKYYQTGMVFIILMAFFFTRYTAWIQTYKRRKY